jgi:hypothetical protein
MTETNWIRTLVATLRDALQEIESELGLAREGVDAIGREAGRLREGLAALGALRRRWGRGSIRYSCSCCPRTTLGWPLAWPHMWPLGPR